MLKRIGIHNFNCFVDFELEVPRTCLLVGSNGSGKTSLWEALAKLQDLIVRGEEVSAVLSTASLTRWLRDDPVQRFGLTFEVAERSYRYDVEILHDAKRRRPQIQRERLMLGDVLLYQCADGEVQLNDSKQTRFKFSNQRSFLSMFEMNDENAHTVTFRDKLADLWLLAPSPHRIVPTTQAEAYWLDRQGSNFASWFRGVVVERPHIVTKVLEALRPAIPGLRNITLERISSEVRELMLSFHTQGSDYKLSAGELSDGQRTLLFLYGFLFGALDRPATIFIDEPEVGLAPHEMQPFCALMSRAIEEQGGQAIVISHHPEVIDYIASGRTIQFRRPHGGPARTHAVTLETTGGRRVSEWISRPWAYEEDEDEGDDGQEASAP